MMLMCLVQTFNWLVGSTKIDSVYLICACSPYSHVFWPAQCPPFQFILVDIIELFKRKPRNINQVLNCFHGFYPFYHRINLDRSSNVLVQLIEPNNYIYTLRKKNIHFWILRLHFTIYNYIHYKKTSDFRRLYPSVFFVGLGEFRRNSDETNPQNGFVGKKSSSEIRRKFRRNSERHRRLIF